MMDSTDWSKVANDAVERDPRQHPIGYFTDSSSSLYSAGGFVWFDSLEELTRGISEVEPRMYGLEPGEGLEAFQERVQPLLEAVIQKGLTEELRLALDKACSSEFRIFWWGTFTDLCAGRDDFAREVLDAYLDEDHAGQDLPAGEVESFVDFLHTYGV
jgi:hypothetical protein